MKTNAELFADDILLRWPQADLYPWKSWSYPQGFLLWGYIRLYEKTGNKAYWDYVMEYCSHHVTEDGIIPAFNGDSLDDICTGSVIVWAYARTGEEKYRKAAGQVLKAYDDYPRNEDGGFWHDKRLAREMWVDGLFMGLMFLTRYGKYIGDEEFCYGETIRQLKIVFKNCRKDWTGLLYHAYSEDRKAAWANRITGCSPEVWSEGLGWYAMILAETLALLPPDYSCRYGSRVEIEEQLRLLCRDLVLVQDNGCGLWYQVVDKPGFSRNFFDTSGSAMFLYTIKKGLDMGVIAGNEYEAAAQKGLRGICSKCLKGMDGHIHVADACNGLCVQVSYDFYADYTRTMDAQEALAAVLWALTAMEIGTSAS